MPPQTHLKIAHDATRRGLDRPSAAAKAGRGVLHAPRPDAPIAAQRGAASEKDAAGPPGVAVPGFFGWLARQWIAFRESCRRRMMRLHLRDLSEAQLIDIGLNRGDIEHIAAHRALEKLKDSTARLMISRGVM